jgi:hypothetical protein
MLIAGFLDVRAAENERWSFVMGPLLFSGNELRWASLLRIPKND